MGTGAAEFDDSKIPHVALKLGLSYVETANDLVVFNVPGPRGNSRGDVAIDIELIAGLSAAIDRGAEMVKDYEGWVDPEIGFAEFELLRYGRSPLFYGHAQEKFEFDIRPCSHAHSASPPFEEYGDHIHPLVRVTSPDGQVCIEISRNGPFCPRRLPLETVLGMNRGSRSTSTLKVFMGGPMERFELERKSISLANSMIFELNARNRTACSLRPRVQESVRRSSASAMSYSVRFPRTSVPDSVAALFSSPHSPALRGNWTFSFLSYYQILEYYIPVVHRRDAVRSIRRLMRSLDFDVERDSSLVKVLNSVERSRGASEADQLRTLIEECVPEDKMRAFFEEGNAAHFSKKGPIAAVGAIHLNSGESLGSQVAKRVYALRNRIVHAKDDARYADAPVLLPGSVEAENLLPEIELMRLLAIEVIVDNR
ncbi:hypothetical protein AB0O51_13635 [Streptomyces sp. NPDC090301]|uniref:hypothetical protein n=1 Tax=Streptomyces sp. NPDC090301 TaxID=3154975 RepID=UPI0034484879